MYSYPLNLTAQANNSNKPFSTANINWKLDWCPQIVSCRHTYTLNSFNYILKKKHNLSIESFYVIFHQIVRSAIAFESPITSNALWLNSSNRTMRFLFMWIKRWPFRKYHDITVEKIPLNIDDVTNNNKIIWNDVRSSQHKTLKKEFN